MSISYRLIWFVSVIIGLSFWLSTIAWAQGTTGDRAGISISPAMYDELHDPNTTHRFTLRVTNEEPRDRVLFITARDITGVLPDNTPIFAEPGTNLSGYELASWLEFSDTEIAVGPSESTTIEVTIWIPEDAPPGSHFGGINIASEAPQLRQSGAGIAYGVTNIMHIRVAGDADEQAMIRSLSTDKYFYGSTDVQFTARVTNDGNVLQRPDGLLEITNMFGREVAQLRVNESRRGIYPGSEQTFVATWFEENPGFGRYEAVLSMSYGSAGRRTITSAVSFWILPLNIIVPAVGVLAVLLLAVYIGVRLYVRQQLAAYAGTTRRVQSARRRTSGAPFGLTLLIAMLMTTALFLIILLAIFA